MKIQYTHVLINYSSLDEIVVYYINSVPDKILQITFQYTFLCSKTQSLRESLIVLYKEDNEKWSGTVCKHLKWIFEKSLSEIFILL